MRRYGVEREGLQHAPGRDCASGSRHEGRPGSTRSISISPENFAYVTGFLSPTQPLMRWRHAMALVTADGSGGARCRRHGSEHHPRQIAAGNRDRRLARIRVRRHERARRASAQARLGGPPASASRWTICRPATLPRCRGLLPQARFAPVQAMLARLREIKTPQEIDILRRLSRIADRRDHRRPIVRCARASSEMDLAAALTRGIYEAGRRVFQADDRCDRRAQRLSQRRPDRPRCSEMATSAGSRSSR